MDAFDPFTQLLTVDRVTVNGLGVYQNVRATVLSYTLLGVDNGAPSADSFDPATKLLSLGAVQFQGATYNNVRVKINAYTLLGGDLVATSPVVVTPPVIVPPTGPYRTLYVAKNGNDSNTCLVATAPCLTITKGIAAMASGDTLVVGDGTYTESITNMPSGVAASGAYTTIQAANDWGVVIDGSGFANNYNDGIRISSKSWVTVRGFKVKMAQANDTNLPVNIPYSNHIRVQRVSASYGGAQGNVANIGTGPASSYVLIEEAFAYGGGRYNFLVYQSDHVIVRRSVSRTDYWNGSLQCAGFTNYNAVDTLWQNNIVLDSKSADCVAGGYPGGHLFAGFFNENKVPDSSWSGTSTKETFRGNIVLNVQAIYAGMYDYDISNVHTYTNNIIWNSHGGLFGDYLHGDAPSLNASQMTIGAINGTNGSPLDGASALGTGYSISSPSVSNALTNSILWNNASYGMADNATGDYNVYFGNGTADRGGVLKTPAAGAHDQHAAIASSLKYLPRLEPGSALATAGAGSSPVGADVRYMWGQTGTLWGEAGYDSPTSTCLWPFPNEAVIKAEMSSYNGPGGAGVRGFTSGNSMDGTPQSLTKYVWEYLGNQIPAGPLCP